MSTTTIGPGIGAFDVPLPPPEGGSTPFYPLDTFKRLGKAAFTTNEVIIINRRLWPNPGGVNIYILADLSSKGEVVSWKQISRKEWLPDLEDSEPIIEIFPVGDYDADGNTEVLFWG